MVVLLYLMYFNELRERESEKEGPLRFKSRGSLDSLDNELLDPFRPFLASRVRPFPRGSGICREMSVLPDHHQPAAICYSEKELYLALGEFP